MRFLLSILVGSLLGLGQCNPIGHQDKIVKGVPLTARPRMNVYSKRIPNPHYESLIHTDEFNSTQSESLTSIPKHILTAPVPISGCASVDFTAPVYIAGQGPFNLIIDTGSTTLAVATSACTNCGVSPLFTTNPANLIQGQQPITSTYGDGSSWTGNPYTEQVSLGSASAKMIISSLDSMAGNFFTMNGCNAQNANGNTNQGIMGYAYPGLALPPTQQFHSQYVATGAPNIFAIQMCRTGGTLWNGGYDPQAYDNAQLNYVPIINTAFQGQDQGKLYYTVNMQSVGIASSAAPTKFTTIATAAALNAGPAIFDSGTSLFALPQAAATLLSSTLDKDPNIRAVFGNNFFSNNAGSCVSPMNGWTQAQMNANLPKLRIVIADANNQNPLTMTLNAVSSYILTITDSNDPTGQTLLYCPGYSPSPQGTIMGWSIMNQFVFVHDIQNSMMGIAPSNCFNQDPTSSPPGTVTGGVTDPAIYTVTPNINTITPSTPSPSTASPSTVIPSTAAATTNRPTTASPTTTKSVTTTLAPQILSVVITKGTSFAGGANIPLAFTYTAGVNVAIAWLIPTAQGQVATYLQSRINTMPVVSPQTIGKTSFVWTVPTDGSVPAGTYNVAVGTSTLAGQFITATSPITITTTAATMCMGTPCGAHGTCSVVNNAPVCTCFKGFMAQSNPPACVAIPTPTTSLPSTASPTTSTPTTAKATTSRPSTALPTTAAPTSVNPCLNGGTFNVNDGTCTCPANFQGLSCENVFVEATQSFGLSFGSIRYQLYAATLLMSQDISDAAGAYGNAQLPFSTYFNIVNIVEAQNANNILITFDIGCDTVIDNECSLKSMQSLLNTYENLVGTADFTNSLTGQYAQLDVQQVDPQSGVPIQSNPPAAGPSNPSSWPLYIFIIIGVAGVILLLSGIGLAVYCLRKRESQTVNARMQVNAV